MSLIFMDGMYYPIGDILFKYSGYYGLTWLSMNAATRRSGPSSIKLTANAFGYQYLDYSLPVATNPLIIGFAMKFDNVPTGDNGNYPFVAVHSSNGVNCLIEANSDFSMTAYKTSYASLDSTAPNVIVNNVWAYFEMEVYCHDSTGYVKLRINNVEVLDLTNKDTKGSTIADIGKVQWRNNPGASFYFQDLYIINTTGSSNTTFLGDSKVEIVRPNAPGTHTDFTPSAGANWENVDEVDCDDDTTYNQSKVVDEKDTYNLSAIAVTGAPIFGIQQQSIVRKTDASIRYGKQLIRSGTTEVLTDEYQFNDNFTGYHHVLDEDPDTSTTWVEAGINALESGLKVTV